MVIPEDAVVMARVEVVQFINPENGVTWWACDHNEDAPLTTLLGLLHAASVELYLQAKEASDG